MNGLPERVTRGLKCAICRKYAVTLRNVLFRDPSQRGGPIVFDGVERHYGDELFVLVELVFVGLLSLAIIWLRRNHPIPEHTEMTTDMES